MRKGWSFLALAFLVAGTPAGADGQLEPPDLADYLVWGPLRVRPGFEISQVGYDDNILASSTERVSDYLATWSPKVEGLVLFGNRAFLVFREKMEFTAYLDNRDQNFYNQKGAARLTVPLRRVGFFADVVLNRVKERPVDQEDIRPERDEDAVGLGLIVNPGWRTEIEIGRSHTDWNFFDPNFTFGDGQTISELLDRSERRDTLAIKYRLLGRLRLTLDAHTENIDFDTPIVNDIVKNSQEWSAMPGVEFGEGGRLAGSARIGWAEIDADDPSRPDFADVVGEVELSYRLGHRTNVRFEARREPGFSIYRDRTYFLHTRYETRVVFYLNRAIGLESGGRLGKLTFSESETEPFREDRIRRYDVGVRLRLQQNSMGRRVEYSLRVGRYRRDSNLPSSDQSRTTVSLGAVVGF